jgi:hypothetical protein
MHIRVQVVSILFSVVVLATVFELIRRRYLRERYALLWMSGALVLLVLAIWKSLLNTVSKAVGIYYPPNAFFVIAFAFLLLLLLHFSAVVSRMSDHIRLLAQRVALLEERERSRERANAGDEQEPASLETEPAPAAEGHEHAPPVVPAGSASGHQWPGRARD